MFRDRRYMPLVALPLRAAKNRRLSDETSFCRSRPLTVRLKGLRGIPPDHCRQGAGQVSCCPQFGSAAGRPDWATTSKKKPLANLVTDDDDLVMRYPGGKGKCFQQIINLMPSHTTYIESHLGGGAVLRHKKPAEINIGIDADARVISRWQAEYPEVCRLVHGDATNFLATYPYTGGELIYCDPPYLKSTRRKARLYRHDLEHPDHVRLLDVLKTLPCKVMISGYHSELYRDSLSEWNCTSFATRTQADVRMEFLWCNFQPPQHLHDGTHLGATFRERQSIKRRHQRWLERLNGMPPAERGHLLSLIRERYMPEIASS